VDPYINLAQKTIETFVKTRKMIEPPSNLPAEMIENQAGVFVSIHTKENHDLRGCIGTFTPTEKNIAHEIIRNAISASQYDPRFEPIREDELDNLEISVDILQEPERIHLLDELNPKVYGAIVKTKDGRTGLLLPDIPEVETVDDQLNICCKKGNIDPETDEVELYRFMVERHQS